MVSADTWIAVVATWTASAAASTTAKDTWKIATDAWKAWADALDASEDKWNRTLDACNALKLESPSSLVDAKLLEAALEALNAVVKVLALAVKWVSLCQ
jgi:hypothetical protein